MRCAAEPGSCMSGWCRWPPAICSKRNVHVVAPGGEKIDLITHQGEAVGYLVSGTIELTIDDTTYLMTAGDSFFFKAYLTNSYRNVGPDEARIVWVNTPQVH